MGELKKVTFIDDYLGIHRRKEFPGKLLEVLSRHFEGLTLKEVKAACKLAYAEHDAYLQKVRKKGQEIIEKARGEGRQIIVLAGRPYHLDPETNHGIDKLIASFGAAIVTEDAVSDQDVYKRQAQHQSGNGACHEPEFSASGALHQPGAGAH